MGICDVQHVYWAAYRSPRGTYGFRTSTLKARCRTVQSVVNQAAGKIEDICSVKLRNQFDIKSPSREAKNGEDAISSFSQTASDAKIIRRLFHAD